MWCHAWPITRNRFHAQYRSIRGALFCRIFAPAFIHHMSMADDEDVSVRECTVCCRVGCHESSTISNPGAILALPTTIYRGGRKLVAHADADFAKFDIRRFVSGLAISLHGVATLFFMNTEKRDICLLLRQNAYSAAGIVEKNLSLMYWITCHVHSSYRVRGKSPCYRPLPKVPKQSAH